MSKKLSTAQLPPPCCRSVVWPGLGIPKSLPAVMRRRSKSGSPLPGFVICPKRRNICVSNDCVGAPGVLGPMWVSKLSGTVTVRFQPPSAPVPWSVIASSESEHSSSPPSDPPG
jgi:hypothetical protein